MSSKSGTAGQASETASGILTGMTAFLCWGLLPIYWKTLLGIPAPEILCHRIVWSLAFIALVLFFSGRLGELRHALASRRTIGILCLTSLLVSTNWGVYIWAVNSGHVLQASLGYYINPLVNVLLGCLFLGERPRPLQAVAIALATIGVSIMVVSLGQLPWVALVLAFSFGLYGLARKIAQVESLPGLLFETMALGVPATVWLVWLAWTGQGALGNIAPTTDLLLIGAGVVTAVPLAAFAHAARRLTLATVGVLQYIAPTCMFLLGVFVYGEEFTTTHLTTFLFIWAGVAVYTSEGFLRHHRQRKPRAAV